MWNAPCIHLHVQGRNLCICLHPFLFNPLKTHVEYNNAPNRSFLLLSRTRRCPRDHALEPFYAALTQERRRKEPREFRSSTDVRAAVHAAAAAPPTHQRTAREDKPGQMFRARPKIAVAASQLPLSTDYPPCSPPPRKCGPSEA